MIKQCQFRGIDDKGHIFCQPLGIDRDFEKTASVLEFRSKLHPRIQDFVRAIRPSAAGVYVLVNALGAGEYWGSNVNGDLFPEKALIHSPPDWENLLVYPDRAREVGVAWPYGYPTFMGAYPYKHHVNKDPSRAFGRVELATWNPKMHRVELVVYLDRALCAQFDATDVINRIDNGEYPDVSMGCKVPYDVCTICEHASKTPNDYCIHAKQMMNQILPDGRKVAVRNDFPKFFDISFVFIGADKTAKTMAKLAEQRDGRVCMGDFCTFTKTASSASLGEIFTKTADPIDESPSNFGYSKERAREEQGQIDIHNTPEQYRPTPLTRRFQKMEDRIQQTGLDTEIKNGVEQPPTVTGKVAGAKPSHLHGRMRNALVGASIGAGAGLAGNTSVGADRESMKKDIVKDSVAGALAGALAKHASADPARDAGLRQWRRQKLSEMYGVDLTKEANDPIKKKIRVQGIPVWIEWLKGETREYKDAKGVVKYSRHMEADYGYIPGTLDSDGEDLDVYWGGDKDAKNAFVIRQLKKSGSFDEHKVMLGFGSKAAAKASYVHHMGGTPERFGGMTTVPVAALIALFADNKGSKEKHASAACSCYGVGDDCGGSIEKLGSLLFPVSKSASHAKLSEIIKSIPAGPFSQETLPKLERAERDIPNDVLDMMGGMDLSSALSTSSMAGMVLKPREFQRMILIRIGERPLADDLDNKGMTFPRSNEVDESIPLRESSVDSDLMELLSRIGLIKDRSAAAPALARRASSGSADAPFRSIGGENTSEPVLKKIAAAYNGYRRSLLKKAASISHFMTTDPQLRADLFGSSMAEAFACGIDKVASASAFSPDSLAYLVGAYTDRDIHMTKEVVASLALTGAVVEAA